MRKRQDGYAALIVLAVLILLALSSMALYSKWQDEVKGRAAAEANLKTANDATKACNDSIAGLEAAAREQGAQAEKDRQAADDRRKKRNQRADKELATPPTVPGNDCQSAQDRVKRILGGRQP